MKEQMFVQLVLILLCHCLIDAKFRNHCQYCNKDVSVSTTNKVVDVFLYVNFTKYYPYITSGLFWINPNLMRMLSNDRARIHIFSNSDRVLETASTLGHFPHDLRQHEREQLQFLETYTPHHYSVNNVDYEFLCYYRWLAYNWGMLKWNQENPTLPPIRRILTLDLDVLMLHNPVSYYFSILESLSLPPSSSTSSSLDSSPSSTLVPLIPLEKLPLRIKNYFNEQGFDDIRDLFREIRYLHSKVQDLERRDKQLALRTQQKALNEHLRVKEEYLQFGSSVGSVPSMGSFQMVSLSDLEGEGEGVKGRGEGSSQRNDNNNHRHNHNEDIEEDIKEEDYEIVVVAAGAIHLLSSQGLSSYSSFILSWFSRSVPEVLADTHTICQNLQGTRILHCSDMQLVEGFVKRNLERRNSCLAREHLLLSQQGHRAWSTSLSHPIIHHTSSSTQSQSDVHPVQEGENKREGEGDDKGEGDAVQCVLSNLGCVLVGGGGDDPFSEGLMLESTYLPPSPSLSTPSSINSTAPSTSFSSSSSSSFLSGHSPLHQKRHHLFHLSHHPHHSHPPSHPSHTTTTTPTTTTTSTTSTSISSSSLSRSLSSLSSPSLSESSPSLSNSSLSSPSPLSWFFRIQSLEEDLPYCSLHFQSLQPKLSFLPLLSSLLDTLATHLSLHPPLSPSPSSPSSLSSLSSFNYSLYHSGYHLFHPPPSPPPPPLLLRSTAQIYLIHLNTSLSPSPSPSSPSPSPSSSSSSSSSSTHVFFSRRPIVSDWFSFLSSPYYQKRGDVDNIIVVPSFLLDQFPEGEPIVIPPSS